MNENINETIEREETIEVIEKEETIDETCETEELIKEEVCEPEMTAYEEPMAYEYDNTDSGNLKTFVILGLTAAAVGGMAAGTVIAVKKGKKIAGKIKTKMYIKRIRHDIKRLEKEVISGKLTSDQTAKVLAYIDYLNETIDILTKSKIEEVNVEEVTEN